MEYEFRAARPGEEDRIMEIIGHARQQMHDEGRAQWDGEYPAMHHILGDTNYDNSYMLKVLSCLHFTHCGTVRYPQGSRLAFEKLI